MTPELLARAGVATGDPLIWPNGVVPYEFADNVTQQNRERTLVFMNEVHFWSNARFVPRTGTEEFWVTIRSSSSGNSATVGPRRGGVVNINAWDAPGFIAHELMHTLGFIHEQSRPDRDQYVEVICECVAGGCSNGNFAISPTALEIGPYDFESVMHYPSTFALSDCADGRNLLPLPQYSDYANGMGDWSFNYDGLSNGDIWALYVLYGGDPVPGPFQMLEPTGGTEAPRLSPIAFRWSASELSESYRIQIASNPRFRGLLVDAVTTEPVFRWVTPGLQRELSWRVTAVNSRGETPARVIAVESVTISAACGLDLTSPPGLDGSDLDVLIRGLLDEDIALDFDPNGTTDMFDVLEYSRLFTEGCNE